MKIFISGGCKNGKSYYAQHLAKALQTDKLYYIATMAPVDNEDDERIARHRQEREGWGFVTIEQPYHIEEVLLCSDHNGSFLLDSVTALLANEMFSSDGSVDRLAAERIIQGLSQVADAIDKIVFVSDYIYSDATIYDDTTELYRRSLASIDRYLAGECDAVLEIAYTGFTIHKGGATINELCKKIS